MKSKSKVGLALLAAVTLSLVGYGVGRAQEPSSDVSRFRNAMESPGFGSSESYDELAGVIGRVPTSPSLTKEAISVALVDEMKGKGKRSDAVLIAQNAQIIALLQKIATKK